MLSPKLAVAKASAPTTCGQPGPHGGKWYHLRGGGCGGVGSVAVIGATVCACLYQAGVSGAVGSCSGLVAIFFTYLLDWRFA